MPLFTHDYSFDPSYGHDLDSLLLIPPPQEPEDFSAFWSARFEHASTVSVEPVIAPAATHHDAWNIFDLRYRTTDDLEIGGWLAVPTDGHVRRGIVVGHGYGGRDAPDLDWPNSEAALLFLCARGISRSRCASIPGDPAGHVVHHINNPDRYVLGGCVDDTWLAVSALSELVPDVSGDIGYIGTSFGGGIGALAIPWDNRISIAHLGVPAFGNQPLRLTLPTTGSGAAVAAYEAKHGGVSGTLRYYDAATAAKHVRIPVHVAAALFDPVVAPPGQFSIYNALSDKKELFVLSAGHFEYPERKIEEAASRQSTDQFFDEHRGVSLPDNIDPASDRA